MSRFRASVGLLAACAGAVVSGPASSHHSFAMFDRARTIDLVGRMREFQWVNPHTWVQFDVLQNGRQTEWSIAGRTRTRCHAGAGTANRCGRESG